MSHILSTYLSAFIAIVVKGLFHSDWLGACPAASPIGPQLGEGETGKSGKPLSTIDLSCWWIWQVFLTLPRQNCHVTHPPPFQLRTCSTLQQIQDKLLVTVYVIFLCHIDQQNHV
jgi:hypothetical protein